MPIALDATYSVGSQLTGVGVYCREILHGLAATHPDERFHWTYRPHRFFKSFRHPLPRNCSRRFLLDQWAATPALFHGMNQRLPRWRARRTVTTFHDLFVLTNEYSTAEFRSRFAQLARDAAQRSDLIIAVSQFTADRVVELLQVERNRLRVVHHGVHMPASSPEGNHREPIVLHVGAIQKRKNTARLLEAFQSLPQPWRLVLAGPAGYGAGEVLSNKSLTNRVEITGYVSEATLSDLYRRAAIFAFPSLDEGFGIPVLEAMAHGVPVIASNTSAIPEVCGDAALSVDPTDSNEIARALTTLAGDSALRSELAKRGRARAAQFPWSKAVENTWQVYGELLG